MCKTRTFIAATLILCGATMPAWALKLETYGNVPLAKWDYADWPTIGPVVNHPTRVYSSDVNGAMFLGFTGTTRDLNDCLARFADASSEGWEVAVLPDPGTTKTFEKKEIRYDWSLNLVGGIAKTGLTHRGLSAPSPRVTIRVGELIELAELRIPSGLRVLELDDLKQRECENLLSGDASTKYASILRLVTLARFDPEIVQLIAGCLRDPDAAVRKTAWDILKRFNEKAEQALIRSCEALKSENEARRDVAVEQFIANADEIVGHSAERERREAQVEKIHEYVKAWKTAAAQAR